VRVGLDSLNYWHGYPDKSPDNAELFNGTCTACERTTIVTFIPETGEQFCTACLAFLHAEQQELFGDDD
jgi:hypothetical protein